MGAVPAAVTAAAVGLACLSTSAAFSAAEDCVKMIRAAYDKTMKDPGFIKATEKMGLELDPLTGDQIQAIVKRLIAFSPEVVQRAKVALNEN